MKKNKKIITSIVAILIALAGGYVVSDPPSMNSSEGATDEKFTIELERVIDGDTIVFRKNGKDQKMRLLLIDTPESTTTKTGEIQPFGKKSKIFLSDYLVGKTLTMEYDSTHEQEDQYGRTLAYLFADGILVQEQLVREGLARIGYEKGMELYLDKLKEAEQDARQEKKNIWSLEDYVGEYGFNNK